jgi:putative copper export protein
MEANFIVATLVIFLHDLFTVVWMGGLIVTVITYLPLLYKTLGPGPQMKQFMRAFQRQQGRWVHVCMVGLIVTGVLMSNRVTGPGQFFSFNNSYSSWLSIKHILVIAMIFIAFYRSIALGRRMESLSQKQVKLSMLLIVINAILAVAVLFASAVISVLV